jgi:hypothetical protein
MKRYSFLILTIFLHLNGVYMEAQKIYYNQLDILNALDNIDNNPYTFFPDFNNGYFFTSGSRIGLFGDSTRWAIVFEQTGYHNRALNASIILTYYGNCLTNLTKSEKNGISSNVKYLTLISDSTLKSLESDFELISPKKDSIIVRGKSLPILHDKEIYYKRGIEINDFENPLGLVDVVALIRLLDDLYPEVFRANEEELKISIPSDLPLLMYIDKWNHRQFTFYRDMKEGERPSTYETFPQIANVLVNKDTSLFKPTLEPCWRSLSFQKVVFSQPQTN